MIKIAPVFRPVSSSPGLVVPLVLLSFAACATNQQAEPAPAPDAVSVGYGEVSRDHLTGSVSTLSSDDWEGSQPRTLAEMLARIPGVRVVQLSKLYGGVSVQIRGSASFVAGEEPLFVLDGMPIPSGNGEIFSIDPAFVESITVLKDAGTTAIYGSRGANGVILIRTKSGSR